MYFKTISVTDLNIKILVLKYSISLDSFDVRQELVNKISNNSNYILDSFLVNGDAYNRFLTIKKHDNDIILNKYTGKIDEIKNKVDSYLSNNIYLLFDSALSSLEINRFILNSAQS